MPEWAAANDIDLLLRKIRATGIRREDYWPAGLGEHEVTYAANPFTGELHEYDGPREGADAWKKRFDPRKWLTGTIDWYGIRVDRRHWIDDLKTGRWPVDVLTSQLLSYGVYSYFLCGKWPDWECERSITQWPKYPIAGLPVRSWAPPMTALDLECHLEDLRYALTHEETNPTEDGCRFCDSRGNCPAWNLEG